MSQAGPAPNSESLVSSPQQFPCQKCGAKLEFTPGTESLKCPYCGFENAIAQAPTRVEESDFRAALAQSAQEHETHDTLRIKCNHCGAETTVPEHVTAGTCPFCGSNLVFTASSSRLIRPGYLLPFKVTQQQAFVDFRAWIKSLWFAPGDLKQYAASDSKLVGVYVPYWTYDADTSSAYTGERGDDYWETKTYTAIENGKPVTRTRQVRKTRWTYASGTVANSFDDILVLASCSLQRDTEKLEPWDLANLVPYADEYLSGFRAESYQVDLAAGFVVAKDVMAPAIRASICSDIGGDHQRISSVNTNYGKITFKHLLLPVWLSAYRYRDKVYRILVNARTGEVQGERPWSAWKIAAAVLAAAVVVGGILTFVALHAR